MKNAVLIGAEPAGLTAANELYKKSKEWTINIWDESSVIDGISRTTAHGDCRIVMGGLSFFSKSSVVNLLLKELMPIQGAPAEDDLILGRERHVEQQGPDSETEECVMLYRHRVSRIYSQRHFLDYPPMLCGIEAVQMLRGKTDKAAVWNVNAENE